VNYLGHGSVEVWSGDSLLDNTSAAALTNAPRLAVFLTFDCFERLLPRLSTRRACRRHCFSTARAERWPSSRHRP